MACSLSALPANKRVCTVPDNLSAQSPSGRRVSDIKRPVLWAGAAIIAAIFLRGFITGQFGQIGVVTAGLFIFAIAKAAQYYAESGAAAIGSAQLPFKTAQAFTLVLLGFFTVQFFRFEPGAIDHHNVQMGLVALAMMGAQRSIFLQA